MQTKQECREALTRGKLPTSLAGAARDRGVPLEAPDGGFWG